MHSNLIAPSVVSRLTPTEDALFTESAAAHRMGVSPRTLQKWRITGEGPPFVRLSSRCIRYRLQDMADWTQGRLRRSTSQTGHESTPRRNRRNSR